MYVFNKHLRCFLFIMLLCTSFIPHIAASEAGLSAAPATAPVTSRITPGLIGLKTIMGATVAAFVATQIANIQAEAFEQARVSVVRFVVDQLGDPLKKICRAIPASVQRVGASLCRRYYCMSENHQKLFAAFPFVSIGSLCAGLGARCAANSALSPVLRYSLTGAFAISSIISMYKAITAYRSTNPVHADMQAAPEITVQSQLVEKIVKSLRSSRDQAVLALDAHYSLYITALDEDARESFMCYVASQAHMNLFILDANELIAAPALLETVVARAKLSTRIGIHTGAIFYIKNFDVLNTEEHNELATKLSEMISTQTTTTWSYLKESAYADYILRHNQSTPETEALLVSIAETAEHTSVPSILFVASMSNPARFNAIFHDHNQFKTGLKIAHPDTGVGIITCEKAGRDFNFDSWSDCIGFITSSYAERRRIADPEMLQATREEINKQRLRLASSDICLQTIPGGYPLDIEIIRQTIAACKKSGHSPSVKGVLLWGPPGCGKTYLARALAGSLNAPFFSTQLADILSAGASASEKLTNLFEQAQAAAMHPDTGISILFIDECDQLLQPTSTAPDYIAPIAIALRSLLSGFESKYGRVVLIVATNKSPEELDQALTRSRRFDYKIHITYPTRAAREAIIKYHVGQKGLTLEPRFIGYLADNTQKCSASDLVMLIEKSIAIAGARRVNLQEALGARRINIQEALVQELMSMRGISQRPPMGVGGKTIGASMLPPIGSTEHEMRDIVQTMVDTASASR